MRVVVPFKIIWILFLLASQAIAARLSGKVTDENNQPLPFTTVFVENTGKGTIANTEGDYFLDLQDGNFTIIFRFVGYKTVVKTISIAGKWVTLNITLPSESITTREVVVSSGGEDPAYPIIRKAQAKRRFYLSQVNQFKCRAYVKGLGRLLKSPKKFLGQSIDIPDTDSNGAGIFYLSESVSDYFFMKPDEKEVMIASKVSGEPRGFSFNNYRSSKFNIYEPNINVGSASARGLISPIAPTATTWYRYHLLETLEENGLKIHKIEVIPRHKTDPAFEGIIYIQDSTWRVHGLSLEATQRSGLKFLDTIHVNQVYVPVTKNIWMIGNSHFYYHFSVFGIVGSGYFNASVSDYNLDAPELKKAFFGPEVMQVLPLSNRKTEAYWDSVRTVPLSKTEAKDYIRKDSLSKIWNSKKYLDSVDRKSNKFNPLNLVTGYTYDNSYRDYSISYNSLLSGLQYNTVEGLVINPSVRYYRKVDTLYSSTTFEQNFRYGFKSERFYSKTRFRKTWDPINHALFELEGGQFVSQFNRNEPITPFINALYTLFDERNYLKLFQQTYLSAILQRDILNGLTVTGLLTFERRENLFNNTLYTFVQRPSEKLSPNIPVTANPLNAFFSNHNALTYALGLKYRIGQKYITRPSGRINLRSKYPELSLVYRAGLSRVFNSSTSFNQITAGITDNINLGQLGRVHYEARIGTFITADSVPIMDRKHFNGNQTLAASDRSNSFQLLQYYTYSTNGAWAEAHYFHNLGGLFFSRVPLIQKMGLSENLFCSYLHTNNLDNYLEFGFGIGNLFKVIHADYVFSINRKDNSAQGIRIGIGF